MISKIYLCPADKKYGCTWEGSSEDIFEHFSQEHEDLLFFTGSINIALDILSENRLLLIDTEIYLLQTKINEDYLNIYLRYLGPSTIASNLTYDIDLSANGMKMGKQDIESRHGFFSIALECIQTSFSDVNTVTCRLLISGDFTSDNYNDNVSIEEESIPDKNNAINQETESFPQNKQDEQSENIIDVTPNLGELLSLPQEDNPPVETREKKQTNLDESSRSTWSAMESSSPKERNSFLGRSQTFTSEDIKRNIAFKRQASMRSLCSIEETDLDSELKCSNCNGHLASPIFLCLAEHNICGTCYRDNTKCSLCDTEITADRNQVLEGKSINYLYGCINNKNGCPIKLPYGQIEEHEINCTLCQYLCPMEECSFKSAYKNMVCHLSLIHSSVKMFQSFIAIFQKYQEIFLVNETMGIFYCSWTQFDNTVLWKAKFCGPNARKFFCELKFKGKNFKKPLLLMKRDDYYFKEMEVSALKEHKVKPKNSILTITR